MLVARVLSALLMAVAVDAPEARWLGWFALVPLFLSIRKLGPLKATAAGAGWGLSLFLFLALAPDPPITFTLRSCLALTIIPALYARLGVHVTRRAGFSPLLLGLGWVAVEFALRPLSLHHGLLAGTLGDGLVLRTLGNLAGYVLVAFLVAYVSASLLDILSTAYVPEAATRLAPPGSGASGVWWYPLDVSDYSHRRLGPAQPRAPPTWLHAFAQSGARQAEVRSPISAAVASMSVARAVAMSNSNVLSFHVRKLSVDGIVGVSLRARSEGVDCHSLDPIRTP